MSLTVAVCITTHNRRDELARTLAALSTLNPAPDEILIAVDGCKDGTLELLREKYSQVRLIIHEQAQGSIPSRGAVFRLSSKNRSIELNARDKSAGPLARHLP